jgi:hypothetical protein
VDLIESFSGDGFGLDILSINCGFLHTHSGRLFYVASRKLTHSVLMVPTHVCPTACEVAGHSILCYFAFPSCFMKPSGSVDRTEAASNFTSH